MEFMLTCAILMTYHIPEAAYHKAYWNAATSSYGPSQTANILPLFLDVPPTAATKAGAAQALVADLIAHKNTTTSGIIGNAYLLQVLMQVAPEMALEVATRTTRPSWGDMVLSGPGTIWESWTDTTNSHNHPALSATIAR